MGTQRLGCGEHEVGSAHARRERSLQLDAYDRRYSHGDRLAKHRRLAFDTAYTPTKYAQRIHHRRMAIGAQQCVRKGYLGAVRRYGDLHHASQELEVQLMQDAVTGRHNAKVGQRLCCPFHEGVALGIPAEIRS